MTAKRLFSVLGVALLACGLILGQGFAAEAKTIKIGVGVPVTGPAAAYGDNVLAGIKLKVDEVNAAGGINGEQIELVIGDDLCEPKDAGTVGTKFANDKEIVAVIGHVCSGATLAAMPVYVRRGVVAISPTSTNATIGQVGKGWFFRTCYTDDYQAEFLAEYASKVLKYKTVGVFYEQNDYAIGLKDAFIRTAKELGIEIVGEEAYTNKMTDFGPQITKLKAANPDAIFLSGYYNEGGMFARQARKAGYQGAFFGGEGLDNADYIKLAGDAAEGTHLSVPFMAEAASDAGKAFVKMFTETTNRPPDYMSVNAYDCMGILAEVIGKVGTDRKAIRDGLAAYNAGDNAYNGVGGTIYFTEIGDCKKPAFIKTVKGGEFVPGQQMN